MAYLASNNANSTLAVSLGGTSGDTTLQIEVADVALFPVVNDGGVGSDYSLLTLQDTARNREIVKVTRHDTGSASFTVVRGWEGTAIRVWQIGDIVSCRLTAGVVTQTYTHPSQATGAHAATAISVAAAGNISSTNVQAALEELDSEKSPTGHTHAASAITFSPTGGVAATTVQAAIAELDSEKRNTVDDVTLAAGKVVVFEGTTDDGFETTLTVVDPTADRTITLPDASGKLALEPNDNTAATPATGDYILFSDVSDSNKPKKATFSEVSALLSSAQIQPISASVSGNALTISASALALDFRSTTLGSGTVTRVTGTPSNLVISSGSTLGTVNGVQSDIAVLAINNAGTIELAAVNVAGGVDLSETGLISTTAEGGAGAADSATVIYSTTAGTNVAYRVIGIIRSTQATAGTWATAPSLIQGVGGQALAAMQSLGYGQRWQNVTGSRALGTTYYNTTGRPIVFIAGVNSTGSGAAIEAIVNGVVFPSIFNYGGSAPSASITAIVPPGGSYSAAIAAGTGTFNKWIELR